MPWIELPHKHVYHLVPTQGDAGRMLCSTDTAVDFASVVQVRDETRYLCAQCQTRAQSHYPAWRQPLPPTTQADRQRLGQEEPTALILYDRMGQKIRQVSTQEEDSP